MGAVRLDLFATDNLENSNTKFEFRCNGALMPTAAITDTDKITVTWTAGSLGAVGSLDDKNFDATASVNKRTTKETLNDPSLKATYTFTTTLDKTWAD